MGREAVRSNPTRKQGSSLKKLFVARNAPIVSCVEFANGSLKKTNYSSA
jgi:hypothetical protein